MNIDQMHGVSKDLKAAMLRATMGASGSPRHTAMGWSFREPALPFPRTAAEFVFAAIFLLPILAAVQLVVSTPGAPPGPPAPLLVAGVLVGSLGLVYPTRRLVAATLCLYWLAIFVVFAQRYQDGLLLIFPVAISGAFLAVSNRIEKRF